MSTVRRKANSEGSGEMSTAKTAAADRAMKKYEEALRMLADPEYARQIQAAREVLSENKDVVQKLAD